MPDGGHHRSRLGLEEGYLDCEIVENQDFIVKKIELFSIETMYEISNFYRQTKLGWNSRARNALGFLPEAEAIRLCRKYDFDPEMIFD